MSSQDPFQSRSDADADADDSLSTSAIPFPSISSSAAASPAGGSSSSRNGTIPRPPNAWILYRSHKLEQLKQEEADWNARGRRGILTANALAMVCSSPDASGSSPRGAYRCSSPTPSEMTAATPAPATPATPASAAYSPGSPYPNNGSPSSTSNVSSLLAQLWKHESDEVKQSFHELAKQKQKEHKKTWPQYKFSPRVTVKSQLARQRRRSNNGGSGKSRGSASACASAATSPAAEAMSPPASCAASPSVSGGEFQIPALPGPKSRPSSSKQPRKESDPIGAMGPFESAAGSTLPMSPRKRRTPEPPTQDDFCPSPSPLPMGRKTARLPSSSRSGPKSSRTQAAGSSSSNGKGIDVNDFPMTIDYKSTALPTAASPAELTLLPNCDADTRPQDLSPTSWAARDAQTLSLYQPSPYTPAPCDYTSPMPPAVPPSARRYIYNDDDDDPPTSTSHANGGGASEGGPTDYFLNDPFVHRAPIFPGSELFELDPALGGVLDLNHVWSENVDEQAKELFDLSGNAAQDKQDDVATMATEDATLLQQPDWLHSVDWNLTGDLNLDLDLDVDKNRAGPSSLQTDSTAVEALLDGPATSCKDDIDDIAQYLLSQAVEAGFLTTTTTSSTVAAEPSGSTHDATTAVQSSGPAACRAPSPPISTPTSPSPHRRGKSRSPRRSVISLRPRRGTQSPAHAHTASPSPPPLPPLPTIPDLRLDPLFPLPLPLMPSSRVLRPHPRPRTRSTRSSPARSPPSRLSPAVHDDQHQQQQQRVLRSSRGRPKVERERSMQSINGSSSGSSDREGEGGRGGSRTSDRFASPPSTRSTTSSRSTMITLNGSYTEDELLDLLAQRRLERKSGGVGG